MKPERIYAGYLALQAMLGIVFWIAVAGSSTVREVLELLPAEPAVTDAFVFGDVLVVIGSAVAAWGIDRRASWGVPVAAFTAGGVVYPTLYLIGWVSFTGSGSGSACLAIMVPVSLLTLWVTYQAWRLMK